MLFFEDIDLVQDDEINFYQGIIKILEESKIPIVITTSSNSSQFIPDEIAYPL
jgi:hypothetical protein